MALFLVGQREEALFVGLLGTSLAPITLTLKVLATERTVHHTTDLHRARHLLPLAFPDQALCRQSPGS